MIFRFHFGYKLLPMFFSSWDKPSNNLDHRGCDLQVVQRIVDTSNKKKEGIHLEKNNSQLRINEGYRSQKALTIRTATEFLHRDNYSTLQKFIKSTPSGELWSLVKK